MKTIQYFCLLIGWMMLAIPLSAQVSNTLHGIVWAQNGQPLSDVQIVSSDSSSHTTTNSEGYFVINDLSTGKHEIRISHIGYETQVQSVQADYSLSDTLTFYLEPKRYQSPSAVVTATRTRRDIESVPEPVTVISDKQIQTSGSTRLSEILAEQTGLTLTSNHGTGIQVQGFDADYTKIMIDGQPIIGRTAGTLNLDRISVGNVQQVEMIKGPSSALWGSDALAGVINIITRKGNRPFELGVRSRYGTNTNTDLGLNLSTKKKNWDQQFFLNRNSSQGYSLRSNAISQTVPEYQNYTASYRTSVPLTDAIEFELQGRYYREDQSSTDYLGAREDPALLDGDALQEDYSLAPILNVDLGSGVSGKLSHFYSRFRTDTRYHYQEGDSLYEHSKFDQHLNKSELQVNKQWNADHISTMGSGFNYEQLKGERYPGDPSFKSYFIFAQHEWMPTEKWDVIAGFRYDGHSEYTSQLSPKLSARYKLFDRLHLRTSAGSGFKAPDFRQLFLDFTNPTVGYTVIGSSNLAERIQELDDRGQLEQILVSPDQLEEISAERSWAFNSGVDLFPRDNLELRVNFFYNDVSNMIESSPIAVRANGQSVYSYFNLDEVYTRGFETQIRWEPINRLELSGGYQLLEARRKITGTRNVQDENGEVIEEEFSSYEPMFNRSKHSANVKIYYLWEALDIDANIRGNWHGKYGFVDTNGNNYVDSDEYQHGYMIWDAAVAKTFKNRYTLRLGMDNILDFTRPSGLSYLPGRLFYAQLSLQFY